MGDTLLIARRIDATAGYWSALNDRDPDEIPNVLRPLATGDTEVRCDRSEALDAFHWARDQRGWQDDPMPFFMREADWEPSPN